MGDAGNLMAAAVCCLRWRDACIRLIRLIRLIKNDDGASQYTPRVCGAAVWLGSGEELPQWYAGQLDGCGGMRVSVA